MSIYHVHASYIKKGGSHQAAGFARYLLTGEATRYSAYLERAHRSREDLVESGSAHLPLWAKDGVHFWTMATRYERKGGQVALCYQFTLPRELSPAARLELAHDLRATFFDRYPHTFAVHNPHTATGEDQPHLHVMFSTRREEVPSARLPKTWFAQAAPDGVYRIGAGVKKDHGWFRRLDAVRQASAVLINAALEREGHRLAVSAMSLKSRGIDRATTAYDAARENVSNLASWQQMKQRQKLDVDREAICDVVRDAFWRHDQSPYRMQQRQESLERTVARVRHLEHLRTPDETPDARQMRLGRFVAAQHQAEVTRQGLRARLFDEEEEWRYRYRH